MEIPHPLICAYHNEIFFLTLSDLRKESSSTYVHVNIPLDYYFVFKKNTLFDLDLKVTLDKGV